MKNKIRQEEERKILLKVPYCIFSNHMHTGTHISFYHTLACKHTHTHTHTHEDAYIGIYTPLTTDKLKKKIFLNLAFVVI